MDSRVDKLRDAIGGMLSKGMPESASKKKKPIFKKKK